MEKWSKWSIEQMEMAFTTIYSSSNISSSIVNNSRNRMNIRGMAIFILSP